METDSRLFSENISLFWIMVDLELLILMKLERIIKFNKVNKKNTSIFFEFILLVDFNMRNTDVPCMKYKIKIIQII